MISNKTIESKTLVPALEKITIGVFGMLGAVVLLMALFPADPLIDVTTPND